MATANLHTQQLLHWIQENPPALAHQLIRSLLVDYPEDADNDLKMPPYKDFIVLVEHGNQDIEPGKIVGQEGHFAGQTWIEAVTNPQVSVEKMQRCLREADSNPQYYFDDLSGIEAVSYDGNAWYSKTGGNHRTVVGKFVLAMHASATGEKRTFPNVSTTRYHIDHECFQTFTNLKQLIRDRNLDIELKVCSDALESSGQKTIKVFICDNRWGRNREKFGWISASEFQKFANWVIQTNGVIPLYMKYKEYIGITSGSQHQLDYPHMSGEFLRPIRHIPGFR